MSAEAEMTSPGHGGSEQEEEDWDNEDGNAVIARGWPRNPLSLAKHGLRPVWTSWGGYPEDEIPEDIKEFLDETGNCRHCQYVGSIQSLFWLVGCDELVAAIGDPAYTITDEIEAVPNGVSILWIVGQYADEGKIPRALWNKLCGYERFPLTITVVRDSTIPSAVGQTFASHEIGSLYTTSRQQDLPQAVRCVRIPSDRRATRTESRLRELAGRSLESTNLWFRGVNLKNLESTLGFFIPECNSQNLDNEFGPGIYTTDSLEMALRYTSTAGAVMAFKNPDLRNVRVWEPTVDE